MNRKKRFICCIFLVISSGLMLEGCNFRFLSDLNPGEDPVLIREMAETGSEAATDTAPEEETGMTAEDDPGSRIYVHVCGCVKKPGLYTFQEGQRIDAAVRAAGGFSEDADERSVNLAQLLEDGTQIEVLPEGDSGSSPSKAGPSGSAGDGKVHLNAAGKQDLMSLNGIGEGRAEAIIAYREAHGGFSSIEEIKKVDGIGDGIYQKIKDLIEI